MKSTLMIKTLITSCFLFFGTFYCIGQDKTASHSESLLEFQYIKKGKLKIKDSDSGNLEYSICVKNGKVQSLRIKDTKTGKKTKGRRITTPSTPQFALFCLTDQEIDCFDSHISFLGFRHFCFCGSRIFKAPAHGLE